MLTRQNRVRQRGNPDAQVSSRLHELLKISVENEVWPTLGLENQCLPDHDTSAPPGTSGGAFLGSAPRCERSSATSRCCHRLQQMSTTSEPASMRRRSRSRRASRRTSQTRGPMGDHFERFLPSTDQTARRRLERPTNQDGDSGALRPADSTCPARPGRRGFHQRGRAAVGALPRSGRLVPA